MLRFDEMYKLSRCGSLSEVVLKNVRKKKNTPLHIGCTVVHVRRTESEVSACVIIMVRDKISKPLIKMKIHTFANEVQRRRRRRVRQRRKRPIKNQNLVICKMALPPQQMRTCWLNGEEPLISAQMAVCTNSRASRMQIEAAWERLIRSLFFKNA